MNPSWRTTSADPANLTLRLATAADESLLLEWRNDPETRKQSLNDRRIASDVHARWLRTRLSSSADVRIYVAERNGVPVGQARFERQPGGFAEVSISVARTARGQGVGRLLIESASVRAAKELNVGEIVAIVKAQNRASLRAFASAGYQQTEECLRAGEPVSVLRWKRKGNQSEALRK
jgi:RimJ/RimL family protein N-acetyltransferase